MAFDPKIMFNEGSMTCLKFILPEGSLFKIQDFPAALSNRLTPIRVFRLPNRCISVKRRPICRWPAGYGTSPHFIFTGHDKNGKIISS